MRHILLIAAACLVLGCEAKIGTGEEGGSAQNVSVEGKAEAGTISIDAPGFDMKLKIPEVVQAGIGAETDIIYPGAKLAGLHVQGNAAGSGGNGVELRFTSPDAPNTVADWYRDPARAATLTGVAVAAQGTGFTISGSNKDSGDPFTLTLRPANGGGTEGVLALKDRGRAG